MTLQCVYLEKCWLVVATGRNLWLCGVWPSVAFPPILAPKHTHTLTHSVPNPAVLSVSISVWSHVDRYESVAETQTTSRWDPLMRTSLRWALVTLYHLVPPAPPHPARPTLAQKLFAVKRRIYLYSFFFNVAKTQCSSVITALLWCLWEQTSSSNLPFVLSSTVQEVFCSVLPRLWPVDPQMFVSATMSYYCVTPSVLTFSHLYMEVKDLFHFAIELQWCKRPVNQCGHSVVVMSVVSSCYLTSHTLNQWPWVRLQSCCPIICVAFICVHM